jgi:hypothetical protein
MHRDAAVDSQFFTIKDAAASSGAARANLIADTGPAGHRRLLQSSSPDMTTQLGQVLARISDLRSAQSSITAQMDALQSQIDKANLLANARASDTKLLDLITGQVSGYTPKIPGAFDAFIPARKEWHR